MRSTIALDGHFADAIPHIASILAYPPVEQGFENIYLYTDLNITRQLWCSNDYTSYITLYLSLGCVMSLRPVLVVSPPSTRTNVLVQYEQ